VDVFALLADPVRRRILELLGPGEMKAGDVSAVIGAEHGISQPAVSQHLRALREAELVAVRVEGTRRLYRVNVGALASTGEWFRQFANPFSQPLDALATELVRGRRQQGGTRGRTTGREEQSAG
jgi:DNA-binding transcriptional ArsR family regulator